MKAVRNRKDKYSPYDYMAQRFYDMVFKGVVKIPGELSDGTISQYQYWGLLDIDNKPEWIMPVLREAEEISRAVSWQNVKALLLKHGDHIVRKYSN